MNFFRIFWRKVLCIGHRKTVKREIDDELRFHMEMRTEENIAAGLSAEEAVRAARRRFGNQQTVREECRKLRGASFGETTLQDIRFGLRMLLKNPGFTAVIALSLGLGIGANSGLFTVINALWLRPLPGVKAPDQLVAIFTSDSSGPLFGVSSYPDYLEMQKHSDSIYDLIAYSDCSLNVRRDEQTESFKGELVSANYFSVLGVQPQRGRAFLTEEDKAPGAHPVAIISHRLWQRLFEGNADAVGKSISLNGQPFSIVGIAPKDFLGMDRVFSTDVWVPVSMTEQLTPWQKEWDTRQYFWLDVAGRLKSGATITQVQAKCNVLAAQLKGAYPESWSNFRGEGRQLTVRPESFRRIDPGLRSSVFGFSGLMLAVVAAVLAIASANAANLLLARAAARRKEIAIRLSLGASRGRLIRQLLTESVLLAVLGSACGLLMAFWTSDLLSLFTPPTPFPLSLKFTVDSHVLLFTLLLGVTTGLVFGLAPAWQASRPELIPALKENAGASAGAYRPSRLRDGFVIGQVALSLLLLIGAGLFLRSLQKARSIDAGFDPRNVLVMSLDVRSARYDDRKGKSFYQQLLERLKTQPGVQAASVTTRLPLGFGSQRRSISVEGYTRQPNEELQFDYATVGPQYFDAMRVPLVRGRAFTEQDREGAPGAVIVNQTFAERFWPGQNPIGQRIKIPGPQPGDLEIVGVAKNGKYRTLGEEPKPFFYLCYLQHYPDHSGMDLLIRTSGEPRSIERIVRAQVSALDANVPVAAVRTLQEHMGISLLPARLGAMLLGLFGVLALVLASVGLYGVLAYTVTQRNHEIGIRMALGAQRNDVLRLVLRQALILTALGVVIGLPLALATMRFLASFLYGVRTADPLTFTGITFLLAVVALLASYIPARRATKVDPIIALRHE